ncbi:hypothetical protein GW846_01320 [Candidatus Gracilibacteria bacterium]|nr:hypothetical protein [Candidatus Gracilibacteria bacterium]
MGGEKKVKPISKSREILGLDVWGEKGVQMVINKLIKHRYDHEVIVQTLSDLIKVKKWDDTNFISFESFVLKKVRNLKSNDTKLSYSLLWRRYEEKKSEHKIGKQVSMFSDDIRAALEAVPSFASGGNHGGIGQLTIK